MASLLVALAALAALVFAAIKFTQELGHGLEAWCLPLAVLILCVLVVLDRLSAYQGRP